MKHTKPRFRLTSSRPSPDMAKYPTVTLPRDCEALRAAADLLAQPEQESLARELAIELFELVKKYSNQMSASQIVGILDMHKQELIWHHFNEIKKEMTRGSHDRT